MSSIALRTEHTWFRSERRMGKINELTYEYVQAK